MLIERASAQTCEQYLRGNLFTPMSLLSTSYAGETAPPPRGYIADPQGAIVQSPVVQPSLLHAAGGICATASDLVRWTVSLASSPAFARMTGDHVHAGSDDEYGYGVVIDTLDGRKRISHGGALPGFSCFLLTLPDEKITVAVMTNVGNPLHTDAADVANAIARSLFDK
jgi:CubicO group peptidase (beta-lactamase class C family)